MSPQELALKYDLLNSQMNPHFINNAIQSICYAISQGNIGDSINWLNRLSNLCRLVQKSTTTKLISLQEEIDICSLYIELQKDLCLTPFEYNLKIKAIEKDELHFIKVPPLILQPLIENAITHGLKHKGKQKKGKLDIFITVEKEILNITISDNGKGVSRTEKHNFKKVSGISIPNINERLNIINGSKKEQKLIEVSSIKDANGNITGTKSQLRIPLIMF